MFSNRKVLEFRNKENKMSIVVYPVPRTELFRVVRGISIKDQSSITDKNKTLDDIKQLWVDSVVNEYECVYNELFENGILDCLPPQSLELLRKQKEDPAPKEEENIKYEITDVLTEN